jgi:hypothetical protein
MPLPNFMHRRTRSLPRSSRRFGLTISSRTFAPTSYYMHLVNASAFTEVGLPGWVWGPLVVATLSPVVTKEPT